MIFDLPDDLQQKIAAIDRGYDKKIRALQKIVDARPGRPAELDKKLGEVSPEELQDAMIRISKWEASGSQEWKDAKKQIYLLEDEKQNARQQIWDAYEQKLFNSLKNDPEAIKKNAEEQAALFIERYHAFAIGQIKHKEWVNGIRVSNNYKRGIGRQDQKKAEQDPSYVKSKNTRKYYLDYDYVIRHLEYHLSKHIVFFEEFPDVIDNIIKRAAEDDRVSKEGELLKYDDVYDDKNFQLTYAKAPKAKPGTKFITPDSILFPTLSGYEHSTSLYPSGFAYLQLLKSMEKISFEKGKLFLKGEDGVREFSEMDLKDRRTNKGIEEINLPYLRTLYGLILLNYSQKLYARAGDIAIITMPISQLAEVFGFTAHINDKVCSDIQAIVGSYHNVVGVIRHASGKESYYQVLNFRSYNAETKEISFDSPYMEYLINAILRKAAIKGKDGNPKLLSSGEPSYKAHYSECIKPTIRKHRNMNAIENVFIIVSGIERAGKQAYEFHISARNLIKQNIAFGQAITSAKNRDTAAKILKRTFEKTWELLWNETTLRDEYEEIELPDPSSKEITKYIPSLADIESDSFVIRIPLKKKE